MKYQHTASLFFNTPLALMPAKADEILGFWQRKLEVGHIDFEERQEAFAPRYYVQSGVEVKTFDHKLSEEEKERIRTEWQEKYAGQPYRAVELVDDAEPSAASGGAQGSGGGLVAVLPLHGVLSQRVGMIEAMSGGVSTQRFAEALREAVNNPQVKAVIIDTASPGGSVYGIDELATEIHSLRDRKPIIAVCNSLMASAAYYTMSNASEVVITPGGELGSVGVIAMHVDQSAFNEKEGVKPTLITAGKYKAEGNPHEPLGVEALAEIQSQVDRYYGMFLSAVARGREVSTETVRSKYGQGRVVGAREAVRLGMADRVATLDETIERFARPGARVSRHGKEALALLEAGVDIDAIEQELIDGDGPEPVGILGPALQRDRDRIVLRR